MLTLTLASASAWLISLMGVALIGVCALLILIILIQKPKGGGLSAAFGGGGGSASAAFGTKTGDVLTWVTVALFVLFLGLAMGLTWAIHPDEVPDPATDAAQTEAGEQTPEPLTGEDMQGDVPDAAPDPTPGAELGQDVEDTIGDMLKEAEQEADATDSPAPSDADAPETPAP